MHLNQVPSAFNGLPRKTPGGDHQGVVRQTIRRPIALATARKKTAKERGCLAADWVAGRVRLKPTVANASAIFRVSQTYISAAKSNGNTNGKPQANPLTRAWSRANEGERKAFATAYAEALWGVIDTITKA